MQPQSSQRSVVAQIPLGEAELMIICAYALRSPRSRPLLSSQNIVSAHRRRCTQIFVQIGRFLCAGRASRTRGPRVAYVAPRSSVITGRAVGRLGVLRSGVVGGRVVGRLVLGPREEERGGGLLARPLARHEPSGPTRSQKGYSAAGRSFRPGRNKAHGRLGRRQCQSQWPGVGGDG